MLAWLSNGDEHSYDYVEHSNSGTNCQSNVPSREDAAYSKAKTWATYREQCQQLCKFRRTHANIRAAMQYQGEELHGIVIFKEST